MAHHRGLFSLGVAMSIGSTTCLIASILVLPAILALRERYKARKADVKPPPLPKRDPEPAVASAN
jgi:predicted RND superfamily exporter protein